MTESVKKRIGNEVKMIAPRKALCTLAGVEPIALREVKR